MDSVLSQLAVDVAEMKARQEEILYVLRGNGGPGLARRVEHLELAQAKQVGFAAGISAAVSTAIYGVKWMMTHK